MNENTTLVTRQQEHQTATTLYGDQESINQLAGAVKMVAPWAQDLKDHEIGLAVRRAVAMGLDPLNPHEVQIWKDKRGNVNFQLSYTLMLEWVRHKFGDFTDPQYHLLGAEELAEEGLAANDVAYRVTFLMKSDIGNLMDLMSAGYKPELARQMLEISGLGTASASEWNNAYFAPAGRSKAWKVQKRAVVDAIRRKFGTPTRSDIEELRRMGAILTDIAIEQQDDSPGANAMPVDYGRGRSKLFKTEATPRQIEAQEPDLQDDVVVDGDFTEIEEAPEAPPEDDLVARAVEELNAHPETVDAWDGDIVEEARKVGAEMRKAAGWTISRTEGWQRKGGDIVGNQQQGKMLAAVMGAALDGQPGTDEEAPHHVVLSYLFKCPGGSTKALTDAECGTALARWSVNGEWVPTPKAAQEIKTLFAAAQIESGQQRLPL